MQQQLSQKLDSIHAEMVSGHKKAISSITSVEHAVRTEVPAASAVVVEVKDSLKAMDKRLSEHEALSTERHSEVKKVCIRSILDFCVLCRLTNSGPASVHQDPPPSL